MNSWQLQVLLFFGEKPMPPTTRHSTQQLIPQPTAFLSLCEARPRPGEVDRQCSLIAIFDTLY
jgi:hypothetical protein